MYITQVLLLQLLKSESKSEQLLISWLLGGGEVTVIGDPVGGAQESRAPLGGGGHSLRRECWIRGEGGYFPAAGGWGSGSGFSCSFSVFLCSISSVSCITVHVGCLGADRAGFEAGK